MLKISNCFAALLVSIASSGSHAQDVPLPAPDPTYLVYADTSQAARLPDGRQIQMVCMGEGSPTVILTAGLGSWGSDWRKVQGPIAEHTRACSWDRAGFGFSDASSVIQTTDASTADLEGALDAADIEGPYVMVGQSMGGYESLRFTDRHPNEVVGVVLVDASFPGQQVRLRADAATFMAAVDQLETDGVATLKRCSADLAAGRVFVGSPDPDECLKYPAEYPPEITRALALLDTDGRRLMTQASWLEHFDESSAAMADLDRNYGDMPLVVLTGNATPTGLPETILAAWPERTGVWMRGHEETAALSAQGVHRIIPDAGHYIQIDRPDVVIEAVLEVVSAAQDIGADR